MITKIAYDLDLALKYFKGVEQRYKQIAEQHGKCFRNHAEYTKFQERGDGWYLFLPTGFVPKVLPPI